jgi:polyamine oxidase
MDRRLPDRRAFLTALAASAVLQAGLTGCSPHASTRTRSWRLDDGSRAVPPAAAGTPTRVVVVGAGFAGLTAANALATAGVETIVLEARQRLGGRISTTTLAGQPFDLGAAWIHEPRGNPLTELARRARVDTRPFRTVEQVARAGFFDARDGWLDPATRARVLARVADFDEAAPRIAQQLGADASVAQAVDAYLATAPDVGGDRAWARTMLQTLLETLQSGPLEDQSVRTFSIGRENRGARDDTPVGGYLRLIHALAAGVPEVRRGVVVTEVAATGSGVRVQDASGQRHTGSHAIVTIPLGVLKAGAVRLRPQLTDAAARAVQTLGYGTFEKIAFVFQERFWDNPRAGLITRRRVGGDIAPGWLDWTPALGRPALVALCVAAAGRRLAALGPDRATGAALDTLRAAFGDAVPEPTATTVSSWTRDPFTRGAYTYLAVGSTPTDIEALSTPLGGRVLFAGEATSVHRHGYADGALSTGVREAKRLLQRPTVSLTL